MLYKQPACWRDFLSRLLVHSVETASNTLVLRPSDHQRVFRCIKNTHEQKSSVQQGCECLL